MAEAQRADHQPRDDLVADPQIQRRIEHVVRQRDRRRHGDHLAAGQAELHARLALGHAIAHGRYAASELPHGANVAQGLLDDLGEMLVRLMRRQHVVIGRDDGHVGFVHQAQPLLVGTRGATGHAMGEVGALQPATLRSVAGSRSHLGQIALPSGPAALDQTLGNLLNLRVHVITPA